MALDFMRVLWALDHGLQSVSKRMNARLGVTGPQRLVVRIIGKLPGVSAGRLARALHVHPSTLTGVLRRLEDRGVIERRSALEDGRRAHFCLTAEGERINKWQLGTVESLIRRALVRLSPKDVTAACEVLQAVTQELAQLQSIEKRENW
jgi:MarR family transcriptional regulator, organic hydroperoxide resistance regulator